MTTYSFFCFQRMEMLLLSLSAATFLGILLAVGPADAAGIAKELCRRANQQAQSKDGELDSGNEQNVAEQQTIESSQPGQKPVTPPPTKNDADAWTVVDYRVKSWDGLRIPISYAVDCKAELVKSCIVNRGSPNDEVTSKADGRDFQATVDGDTYLLRCDEDKGAKNSLQKKTDMFIDDLCKDELAAERKKKQMLGSAYKAPSALQDKTVTQDISSDHNITMPVTLNILCFARVPAVLTCTPPGEKPSGVKAKPLLAAHHSVTWMGHDTPTRRRIHNGKVYYNFECLQTKAPKIIWDNYVEDLCKSTIKSGQASVEVVLPDGLEVSVAFQINKCDSATPRPEIEQCTATIKGSGWFVNTKATAEAMTRAVMTFKERIYIFTCNRYKPPTLAVRFDFTASELCAEKRGADKADKKDRAMEKANKAMKTASKEEKAKWRKEDSFEMKVSVKNEIKRLDVTVVAQCHHPAGAVITKCVGKGDSAELTATLASGQAAAMPFTQSGVEYTIACDPDRSPTIMKKE